MPGFGFAKPRATQVGADEVPSLSDLPMQDKLMALSFILQGDTASAMQLPMLAAARMRQADERKWKGGIAEQLKGLPVMGAPDPVQNSEGEDISAAFGPLPQKQVGTRTPTTRDLLPLLAKGLERGFDVKGPMEILKQTDPDFAYESGLRYDKKGGDTPRAIPKTGEGQMHVFDAAGNPIGIMNAKGYVQSVAEVEEAKARAKSGYETVEVDNSDGSKSRQTVREFADGRAGGLPMRGGGAVPPPPRPPNPNGPAVQPAVIQNRSQTPAEKALAEGRATNQVKQEGMVGEAVTQSKLDLPKLRDQAAFTLGIIEKIRKHPSLPDRTGNSTLLPALRPQDVDFDTLVKQVSGGAFLEAIQYLRGTGQITEIEGKKATDAILRMSNQRQSQAGFLDAMSDYESVVKAGLSRAENRASGGSATGGGTSRITPEQAAAELARRRAQGARQ
jgi:hypothetical protein